MSGKPVNMPTPVTGMVLLAVKLESIAGEDNHLEMVCTEDGFALVIVAGPLPPLTRQQFEREPK